MNATTIQAARAANMVYCILQHRRRLEREEMSPVFILFYCLQQCVKLI